MQFQAYRKADGTRSRLHMTHQRTDELRTERKTERKTYGMLRMVKAIGRAIKASTALEKERAARWAAAWGVISGIRSRGIRLRRDVLFDGRRDRDDSLA